MLRQDERLEELGNNISVIVTPQHGFGTDAILLANFASPYPRERVCDLCTGCGIIPMLFCRCEGGREIVGVEIQPQAADQFRRSIAHNSLSGRVSVWEADLKNLHPNQDISHFDLVTANPPYQALGTGVISGSEAEKAARHELFCTVFDVADAASKLLKFGGRFCMCHRPERLGDIMEAMRRADIEPKKLQFVVQKQDAAPWLLLVEGKKGGKKGLVMLPQLVIQTESGEYTEQLKSIYGGYAK